MKLSEATVHSEFVGNARPAAIETHVAIGDGRSVALSDGRGGIDWLCWPRFDSEAVFAAILDPRRGGSFRIAPRSVQSSTARYLDGTNVALTRFELVNGEMELLEGMAIDPDGNHEYTLAPEHEIVRMLRCTRGGGAVDVAIDPRASFEDQRLRCKIEAGGTLRWNDRGKVLTLRASQPLIWRRDAEEVLCCSFAMNTGDVVGFSFSFAAERPLVLSPLFDAGRSTLETTIATWRAWAGEARYDGPYREAVVRSALALKLLCYPPSGAIVAAATTSLPEKRGGSLNWDYRFCWLRDAALTARALFGLGYDEEADAFVGWLLHATHLTRPKLGVFYDVFGVQPDPEVEIDSLAGYGGARPVRVGNGAANQFQLDIYGEVIDAVAQAWTRGRDPDHAEVEMLRELGEFVAANWRRPDDGIWEPRSGPQHHVHSRVLCWVALDRLLRLDGRGVIELSTATRQRFERERAAIVEEVRRRGYSTRIDSYVSTLDGDRLDASLLLLSWYGFEQPSSRRMACTFDAIDRTLGIGRHLLRRNLDAGDDGGFMACAFWAAEHLAKGGGSLEQARARFETLLGLAAPSGLYGEIVEPCGAHLGNYPQGFSHLALLNAALSLEQREVAR